MPGMAAARLLPEFLDAAGGIGAHQAEALGVLGIHGQGRHRERGPARPVGRHKARVIHPVELIAREDQHLVHVPGGEELAVLAHRIGRALKPAGAVRGLLGCQHLHETAVKAGGEVVGAADMAIQ